MPAICPTCVSHHHLRAAHRRMRSGMEENRLCSTFNRLETVGYARKGKRAHKLAPRGAQCVMLGIAHNHPRDTVKVLVVQKGQRVNRQNVSWHSETAPGGPISPAPAGDNNTAEPVGVRGSTIEAHTPTQLAQAVVEEPESLEPPRSPEPQHSEQMEAEIEESLDQGLEPMVEPATIPPTVRKLADHFTGELLFVIHARTRSSGGVDSRARSGEIDGGPSTFSGIYWKDERNLIALGAMLTASGAKSTPPIREKTKWMYHIQEILYCRDVDG